MKLTIPNQVGSHQWRTTIDSPSAGPPCGYTPTLKPAMPKTLKLRSCWRRWGNILTWSLSLEWHLRCQNLFPFGWAIIIFCVRSAQSLINSRLDSFATADRDRNTKRERERQGKRDAKNAFTFTFLWFVCFTSWISRNGFPDYERGGGGVRWNDERCLKYNIDISFGSISRFTFRLAQVSIGFANFDLRSTNNYRHFALTARKTRWNVEGKKSKEKLGNKKKNWKSTWGGKGLSALLFALSGVYIFAATVA